MPATLKEFHEYAKAVRAVVGQPRTSLVRADDLAWSASRLLKLAQVSRDRDAALAQLVDDCLGDIAALQPDRAVDRVKAAFAGREKAPEVWVLACHALAQILSEYSSEASAQTITDLRTSLPDWFGKAQKGVEARPVPYDEATLLCLQAIVGQAALFHDMDALDWAAERLMLNIDPQRMGDLELESAALCSGLFADPMRTGERQRIGLALDEAAKTNPRALEVRQLLGAAAPPVDPLQKSVEISRRTSSVSRQVATKRGKPKKEATGWAKFWESYGGFVPWIAVLGVMGLCIWGAGKAWDYIEGTAPVGDRTLKDSYAEMRTVNEQARAKAEEEANAPAIPESDPNYVPPATPGETPAAEATPFEAVPTPEPTPEPSPPPPPAPDPRVVALEAVADRDAADLRARIRMRRDVIPPGQRVAAGVQPKALRVYGEYIRREASLDPADQAKGVVKYWIAWYEDGRPMGEQWIDGRYEWNGTDWKLSAAARSLNRTNEQGLVMYVLDDPETKWAAGLFVDNPFY